MNKIDIPLIEEFFNSVLFVPGHCWEVRCFDAKVDFKTNRIVRHSAEYRTFVAGWFTSAAELSCELSRLDSVSAYISVNPVKLTRRPLHAKNTLKRLSKGEFVTDSDISFIRYVIIDIDPYRLQNTQTNSSNSELKSCLETRDKIIADLGLSLHCITGCSGNGAFILLRVPDYGNDSDSISEITRFVDYIAGEYTSKSCKVDAQTRNPSRLLAIPGTFKYRDVLASAERPHRRVEIHSMDVSHATPDTVRYQGVVC